MATHIRLYHIGEVVLAGLLSEIAARNMLHAVRCVRHSNCSFQAVLDAAEFKSPVMFESDVALAPARLAGIELLFDGAHGIDVLCRDAEGHGLAIEAKLGTDRMAAGAFKKRFLSPVKATIHTPSRIGGSMVSILNHRLVETLGALPLHTQSQPGAELVPSWFLAVRAPVWEGWNRAGCPPLAAVAHVMVLEDLVELHGDATIFDDLIRRLVGDNFFAAWGLGTGERAAR